MRAFWWTWMGPRASYCGTDSGPAPGFLGSRWFTGIFRVASHGCAAGPARADIGCLSGHLRLPPRAAARYARRVLVDRSLRGFALMLTVGAGLALLLGLLGGWLWWFDLFAHFRLHCAGALLLALAVAAARRARRLTIAAGLLSAA